MKSNAFSGFVVNFLSIRIDNRTDLPYHVGKGRYTSAPACSQPGGVSPSSPVFLVSAPVEDTVPTGPVYLEEITFYDKQGQDITEEFDLSGGGIQ